MSAGAFSADGVVKASEGLIRVLVDADKDDKVFGKYGVRGMPTILFLDPEGKEVARMNQRDAASVEKQFKEIAEKHGRGPRWMEGADPALQAGKADGKPVALLFVDDKPKSALFPKIFGDAVFKPELFEKVAFAKVPFEKDSELCKKLKVTEAPALVILDNTGEEPKALRTLKSGRPADFKSALEDAAKKVQKK